MFHSVFRNHTSGSSAYSYSQQPRNAVSRFWSLSCRSSPTTRHSRVALRYILGPAVLTVSARWVTSVAHCEADVNNNNIPVAATSKHTAPEFKWHILWEFVKPQLFALIGAVVVRLELFAEHNMVPWCFFLKWTLHLCSFFSLLLVQPSWISKYP